MKYEIKGKPLPVAILHLDQGESILTDSGAMVWMKPALTMDTVSGGMKSLFGRAFSGETLFLNKYTATEPSMIALGSSFPGDILVYDVSQGDIIVQKSSYLASEETVKREISFSKKLLFCKWVVIIRLFTMFRAHCISISHSFWRQNCHFYKF